MYVSNLCCAVKFLHVSTNRCSIHIIIECICRDGPDNCPLSLNKSNSSELPNTDLLGLFKQKKCSASTIVLSKFVKYTATVILIKTSIAIVHIIIIFFVFFVFFSSNGLPVSNRSYSFTRIIYTGAYLILEAQNFSQRKQTPALQPYKCIFFFGHMLNS